ncbi:disease resistance protein RPH8A-like [Chenopodium quinoa]|uniref:disease resistance protein RPH8A-like n=1 Tax=Chenopodium quinoa TaxID=63459 RepID=UPI000B785A13|nr:disease resistance protein RPH8A-like [Chenopodium quinoa]
MDQIIDQFNRKTNGEIIKRDKMLDHCKGIPLAIVAFGGLLSTKETVEEWETVSTSLNSEETRSDQALENILLLSYHDLPNDIMPCFLYLSLFPPDSEISTGMLIRMWLSEGLVALNSPSSTQKTLENVAAQYLEELACRCLIQVVRRNHVGDMKTIHMHDKIHQVSITKSTELGFLENYPHAQDKPLLQPAAHSRSDVPQIREMHLRRTAIRPGLRHVYLPAYAISSMGKLDLSTLQDLQILWGVSGGDWLTDDLGKINASLLNLRIVNISCTKELESVVNWLNREPKQLQGIQWNCGSNMFLKLEELQISHLPNLVQWRIEAGAMPHLRRLSIFSCQKLLALPEELRYINLQELEILDMPKSFNSRLHEIKDENTAEAKDNDIIRNIPCIKIEAC